MVNAKMDCIGCELVTRKIIIHKRQRKDYPAKVRGLAQTRSSNVDGVSLNTSPRPHRNQKREQILKQFAPRMMSRRGPDPVDGIVIRRVAQKEERSGIASRPGYAKPEQQLIARQARRKFLPSEKKRLHQRVLSARIG
jgi:hypothetical protein